jgi:hypothetical protein
VTGSTAKVASTGARNAAFSPRQCSQVSESSCLKYEKGGQHQHRNRAIPGVAEEHIDNTRQPGP